MALGEEELSDTELLKLFSLGMAKGRGVQKVEPELSDDEVTALFSEGMKPGPGPGQTLLGKGLELVGETTEAAGRLIDFPYGEYMAGMQPPSSYGGRGPLPSWGVNQERRPAPPPIDYSAGVGDATLGEFGRGLRTAGELVYPQEVRGTGTMLGETLPSLAVDFVPGLAATVAGGPLAGGAVFAHQFGSKALLETLEETGDPEKALTGYIGEGAISTLNELGFGGPLRQVIAKFKSPAGQKALGMAAMLLDFGRGAGKTGLTAGAQTGLSAALDNVLTDEDRDILREASEVVENPAITGMGGILGVLGGRGMRLRGEAPKPKGEAKPVEAKPEIKPEPQDARTSAMEQERKRFEGELKEQPGVTEAERAWARKFLGRPEPKEGPIGFPDLGKESLEEAVAAERAGGKHGPIRIGEEAPPTEKRWPMGTKPSVMEPLSPIRNAQNVIERLDKVRRDYKVPQDAVEGAHRRYEQIEKQLSRPGGISDEQAKRALRDLYDETLREWGEKGYIPKQVDEPIPPPPPSPAERRVRAQRAIEVIGRAAGVTDEEIATAGRMLGMVPDELLDDEFAEVAKRFRGRRGPKEAPRSKAIQRMEEKPTEGGGEALGAEPGLKGPEDITPPREVTPTKSLPRELEEGYVRKGIHVKGPPKKPAVGLAQRGQEAAKQGFGIDPLARMEIRPAPKSRLEALREQLDALYRQAESSRLKDEVFGDQSVSDRMRQSGSARRAEELRKEIARIERAERKAIPPTASMEIRTPPRGEEPLLAERLEEANRPIPELPPGTKTVGEVESKRPAPTADEALAPRLPGKKSEGVGSERLTKVPDPKAEPGEGVVEFMAGLPPFRGKAVQHSAASAKAALKKAKETFVDWFVRAHGGKPETAARMEERAKGEVEVEASRARTAARQVEKAIEKYNKANPGSKVLNERLDRALKDQTGAEMAALPQDVRPTVERLREHVDRLSRTMIDEGMTNKTMTEVLEQRMGEYLRTTYKARVDPKWAEKVDPTIRNKLESLLVSWSQPPAKGVLKQLRDRAYGPRHRAVMVQRRALRKQIDAMPKTDPQRKLLIKQRRELGLKLKPQTMDARRALYEYKTRKSLQGKTVDEIRDEMKGMLADAKLTAENPIAAAATSNLKRKDISLFKARKGMPEEMKAFLGEEKDALTNYTNTILKQASHIANHRKFVEMRAEGLGRWLFEKPKTVNGIEYTTKVSAADNPRLSPLVQGKELYTTDKIKKWLFDSEKNLNHPVMRWMYVLNAGLKGMYTVYQPTGALRQGWQQIAPLVRHGYAPSAIKNAKEIYGALRGDPAHAALREKLVHHRVIDTSVAAAEFTDLQTAIKDRKLNEPWATVAKWNETFVKAFSIGDNFTKTAGFLKEEAVLLKAGLSPEAAAREAANIVRNVLPTYSRIVKAVDVMRRQPVFGTFMAFKAEQIRTSFETLLQLGRELKSANPVIRRRGQERAAWIGAGTMMAPVGATAWNMLYGVDQEEDDAKRRRVSTFDKQRNLVWLPGKRYIDLSDLDDMSWVTDPLMRIMAGEDASKVVDEITKENVAPFIEPSVATDVFVNYWRERDEYGRPIKDPLTWLLKQAIPSGVREPSRMLDLGLGVKKLGHVRAGK